MKPGNSQFGMRENPASLRLHDSRFAVQPLAGPSTRTSVEEQENSQALPANPQMNRQRDI
jgi:hypothetical protein